MKRITAFLLVCALCALTACQNTKASDNFSLDEAAITAALEKAGLPGAVSEDEAITNAEGYITCVVRNPAETYGDTDNSVLVAGITSGTMEGERVLSFSFDQRVASEQVDWRDWRERLVFAAILYGSFADDEEVYRAFSEKEVPVGQERCQWEAQLSEAYCVATWSHRSQKLYDESRFEVREHHASLLVTIYASRAQYEKHLYGKS